MCFFVIVRSPPAPKEFPYSPTFPHILLLPKSNRAHPPFFFKSVSSSLSTTIFSDKEKQLSYARLRTTLFLLFPAFTPRPSTSDKPARHLLPRGALSHGMRALFRFSPPPLVLALNPLLSPRSFDMRLRDRLRCRLNRQTSGFHPWEKFFSLSAESIPCLPSKPPEPLQITKVRRRDPPTTPHPSPPPHSEEGHSRFTPYGFFSSLRRVFVKAPGSHCGTELMLQAIIP